MLWLGNEKQHYKRTYEKGLKHYLHYFQNKMFSRGLSPSGPLIFGQHWACKRDRRRCCSFVQHEWLCLCQRTTHVGKSERESKSHTWIHLQQYIKNLSFVDVKCITSSQGSARSMVHNKRPLWLSWSRICARPSPSSPLVTTTAKMSSSSSYSTKRNVCQIKCSLTWTPLNTDSKDALRKKISV